MELVTPEFKRTIADGNLRRARIMLKDSLLIDPTFQKYEEMINYAKSMRPDIMCQFDGGNLERDSFKWNTALMNEELIQLVDNFSEERVRHLKLIIQKLMPEKINVIRKEQMTAKDVKRNYYVEDSKEQTVHPEKEEAIRQMHLWTKVLTDIMKKGKMSSGDVTKIKEAANKVLSAVNQYENGK